MQRAAIVFALLAACLSAVDVQAQAPNTLTESEQRSGWELLFDGKTTTGWRTYKKETAGPGWQVRNGSLARVGENAGDLVSANEYDSFELLIDYKISKGGNSGLIFHAQETEDVPWKTGPEVQIQDDENGTDPIKSGWLYELYNTAGGRGGPARFYSRTAGEWNQLYLRVQPGNGEIMLNGSRYFTFNMSSPDWTRRVAASKFAAYPNFAKAGKGRIVLQDHGNDVEFRTIKIRKLTPGKDVTNPITGHLAIKPALAFPNLQWDGWEPEDAQGRQEAFRTIFVASPDDGSNRIFVGEQRGRIWGFENKPDVTTSKLLLDLREKTIYSDRSNEEGLLGMAIHPKFKENGQVYFYYTKRPGKVSIVSRFKLKAGSKDELDPASEEVVMEIAQPYTNHNGGTIIFGPDGHLYIALGDGGSADDPQDNAQNLNSLLGKVLRIDVDKPSNGKQYSIPAGNMASLPAFAGQTVAPEVWCYGLRNPWRIAFDRQTGVLWCGEVGQNLWEEINILTAGGNYGWNRRESHHLFGTRPFDETKAIEPLWEYDHQVGKSITGGSIYRGKANPDLVGKYVYADYVTGKIWALKYDEAAKKVVSNESLTPQNNTPILSFGEDANGELYYCIVAANGKGLFKFVKE